MVIRANDRLSEVLARDERMIEIFVSASPELKGLRNAVTRRIMGRLATVGQIARIAGLEPEILVHRVNHALGEAIDHSDSSTPELQPVQKPIEERSMSSTSAGMPAGLAAIPAELILEVDVREDLRQGKEPFSRIMAARHEMPAGGGLRLRAIFDPVPLYAVMGKQGFDHWTEELAPDDWCVWFYPKDDALSGSATAAAAKQDSTTPTDAGLAVPPALAENGGRSEETDEAGEDVIVLDVRGMEPPEPMVRTLAQLETLPAGKTLLQINERVPQFLLPKLEELGFTHHIREQREGVVRVFIRRKNEN